MSAGMDVLRLIGPERAVELFGIRMVGLNAENGVKVLVTIAFTVTVLLLSRGATALVRLVIRRHEFARVSFWTRQGIAVVAACLLFVGFTSIWFDDPARLATGLGLLTAGLAFALQRVVTAIAGYLVILRGRTFNVGDRIVMGGVRGDVVALGFIQTTIMEMGQPPAVSGDDPAMWVQARQHTGRLVTVTNAKVFEEPVYNYSRLFPYIWEEMKVPIPFDADRGRAERILLDAAGRATREMHEIGADRLRDIERHLGTRAEELTPRVFCRLTDSWLELAVRFVVATRGIRDVKDAMSRDILDQFQRAGIPIASSTLAIVQLPALHVAQAAAPDQSAARCSRQ